MNTNKAAKPFDSIGFQGVLKRLPTDGTFDQLKPLDRLVGEQKTYCFDLKFATDSWPLVLLFEIMCYLFDRSFASSVVNSVLAWNIFEIPFVKRKFSHISFMAGQPLGYYTSWPLFALSPPQLRDHTLNVGLNVCTRPRRKERVVEEEESSHAVSNPILAPTVSPWLISRFWFCLIS
ncbi:unnamed protein product, partial [Vitis vinifera]|uniref:Uncharacterized protein n=1 Tax=Vitis vinifera TaxID=29760 RepID=D7ST78_VITVI